ncbi:alpha-amylase family protein [Haloarcula argentinensis]|uniref:Maltose alpha-D-glucosyltransferase n=1 Tax=Haloarcula argentinensis TaxID=43776 RepID=A0A830FWC1_HALAR|nr:alpha-amylase family protein [Haloarcula argentinensis]GGM43463.1 maltose alpha-D-glucosyltransferase [Haloarcula argentinensis]
MVEHGWHEDAVIYTLDVKTFNDSDGDGWGDFQGLIEKLDYIEDLGVTCLWLRPFYPSPLRDNGYDVADYYGVHDRMGTLADFRELTDRAHDRGIRVLTDLVFNHTSIDHEWFQRAREDPDSKYHDYYLWTSHVDDAYQTSNIFPDREDGVWSYDEVAGKHYFHQFYHHQPDLNVANPAVRDEIHDVMRFWLDQGADGFRIDAAHPMLLPKGHNGTTEGIELFKELKRVVTAAKDHAVLIAEADDQPEHLDYYFGDGEAFDLMFNFVLNAHMVYGVGVRDTWPLHRANEVLPDISGVGQWANFLRNHDEWNLLKLPQEALEHAREYFGPDDGSSWIFGRGHRLRLADLFGHDHDRITMVHSLLFAYPGTPVVLSGDEIGMGSDLWLDERESVRTPMQWDDTENGGFSTADREDCYNPPVAGKEYSFEHINVADQQGDPDSLLSHIQRIIAARKHNPELSDGDLHLAESGHRDVLVHRVDTDDIAFIFAHNFADESRESVLQWEVPDSDTSKELGDGGYHIEDGGVTFLLDSCDYVWLRGDKSDW